MIEALSRFLVLDALLVSLRRIFGQYELLAHWQQGEFHHDLVFRLPDVDKKGGLEGSILVVATNCNGGIKELLNFGEVPERYALWNHRCPDNDEFEGTLPPLLASARTVHWFDPCELLTPDARSELKPEHRVRQKGGGWEKKPS